MVEAKARAEVCVDVDVKEIVQRNIECQVAKALADDDGEKIIKEVIKEALRKQDRYPYDNPFSVAMKKMIMDASKEAFGKWLEKQQGRIRAEIFRQMRIDESSFAEKAATACVDGMAKGFMINIRFPDDDE